MSKPESGKFYWVSHKKLNPTLGLVLGNELWFFGEESPSRNLDDLPKDTKFDGPIPEHTEF